MRVRGGRVRGRLDDAGLARRIADVDALVRATVGDGPLSLVVHDWGGMIGFGWAAPQAQRIERCVVLNTAALIARSSLSGHPPITNLFEYLSFFAWAIVLAFLLALGRLYARQGRYRELAALLTDIFCTPFPFSSTTPG